MQTKLPSKLFEQIYEFSCEENEESCDYFQRCCCVSCIPIQAGIHVNEDCGFDRILEGVSGLTVSPDKSGKAEKLAYESLKSCYGELARQFVARDRYGHRLQNSVSTTEVNSLGIWESIEKQHIFPDQMNSLILDELSADSAIEDERDSLKRAKDGLRRALHILSDSCSHHHIPAQLRPGEQLPQHYQAALEDFEDVGLGEAYLANAPIGESAAARITASLGAGVVSASMRLQDTVPAIWERVPGAGPGRPAAAVRRRVLRRRHHGLGPADHRDGPEHRDGAVPDAGGRAGHRRRERRVPGPARPAPGAATPRRRGT